MKVLLISNEYPFGGRSNFGGGGSHVFYLAQSLVKLGVDVLLLTHAGATKENSPLATSRRLDVFPCEFGPDVSTLLDRAVAAALQICGDHQPDVVHGHHFKGGLVGLFCAAAYELPFVSTMHKPPRFGSQAFSKSAPIYRREASYAIWRTLATDRRVGAHVAYSKVYKQELRNIGVPSGKIEHIYHGVPVPFLREKRQQRLPMPRRFEIYPGDRVIVCPMRPEGRS